MTKKHAQINKSNRKRNRNAGLNFKKKLSTEKKSGLNRID
jgi:hypothetical protein